jgi:outer membrane lipoprotein-sorting protein
MKHLLLLAALALAAPLSPALISPALAQAPRAAVLSDSDQAVLTRVQGYLDGLRTLKARFVQTGPDGKTATGTAWLERPGRMRFEYDKPSPLLLVAGRGTVIFRDNQLDQTSTIPLSQTPLGLLLGDTITLTGPVTVTDFQRTPTEIVATLVRTATPGDGSLTLMLNANPLALAGWNVVDAQGRLTRLRLTNIVQGGAFDENLFTFKDPDADPAGNTP